MKQGKSLRSFSGEDMVCHDQHPDYLTLGTYLDGELSGDDVAAVEIHLESCGECRRKLCLLAEPGEGARRIPTPTWNVEAMVVQVRAEIERAEGMRHLDGQKAAARRLPKVRWKHALELVAAAVAIAIVAASFASSGFRHQLAEQREMLVRSHYTVSSSHVGAILASGSAGKMQGDRVLRVWELQRWR